MSFIIEKTTEILVIGSGTAGMAAAAAAANEGKDVLIIDERKYLGGILPQCIHRGFGLGRYGTELTGPEYCERESLRFKNSTAEYMPCTRVLEISPEKRAYASSPDGLYEVSFSECILAAGCFEKPLWSLSVCGTRPSGVYTAGEAQEMVNLGHYDIGRRIFILGSGDIGQIMARRFTLLQKEVVAMAEIRPELGGLKRNQEECLRAFNIPVMLNTTVTEIHGYPYLEGVTVRNINTRKESFIACDTLITALGLIPDRALAEPLFTGEGYPEWLSFCGNSHRVHEIADSATLEGERTGLLVARRTAHDQGL